MTDRMDFYKIDDKWHVDKRHFNRNRLYNTEMSMRGTARFFDYISKGESKVSLWISQDAYHDHPLSFYREKYQSYLVRSSDLMIDREHVDLSNIFPTVEGELPEYLFADILFPSNEE
jgi:hypothetical protein